MKDKIKKERKKEREFEAGSWFDLWELDRVDFAIGDLKISLRIFVVS